MGVPTRLGPTGSFPVTNQAASDGEGLLDPEGKVQLKWQYAQNQMTKSYAFFP